MTLQNPFQTPEASDALTGPGDEPDDAQEPAERPYTPAEGLDPEAPYGYTIDRKTGEKRPRKRAGRGVRVVKEPEPEQPAESGAPRAQREPDRVPGKVKPEPKRARSRVREPKPEPEPLPVFRAGPIAKSVNKLYLRAGKLVRAMDYDIGTAIIASTKAETEDDVTVGEAWEEVAKNNPRIRRVLLKLISGGAWSQLVMAHAPILLAVLLKERIAKRLPMMGLLSSFLPDDEGEPAAAGPAGGLLAGLTQEDLAEAMAAFNQFTVGMGGAVPHTAPGFMTEAYINGRATMPTRAAVAEDLLGPADAPS